MMYQISKNAVGLRPRHRRGFAALADVSARRPGEACFARSSGLALRQKAADPCPLGLPDVPQPSPSAFFLKQEAHFSEGKEIFYLEAESPKLRRRRAVAKPVGKTGEQARRVRPTQTVVYRHPAFGIQTVYFLFQGMQLENQTSLISLPAEASVGRTSAEVGDSALL